MRYTVTVLDKNNGNPKSGYTLRLYVYSTGTSGYSGSALYTLTDAGNGQYYADVTNTGRYTLVVTVSTGVHVPSTHKGFLIDGDDHLLIPPGGSS